MEIKKIKKEELLKMRDEIDSQLKHIEEVGNVVKKPSKKEKLSDLDNNDEIFCINFYGSKIYNMDFVKISFYKECNDGWVDFSTYHDTKPMGCSSSIKVDCLSNHFFLFETVTSLFFFTLNPQSWKEDLFSDLNRLLKLKEENFRKEILAFIKNINELRNSDEVDEFLSI